MLSLATWGLQCLGGGRREGCLTAYTWFVAKSVLLKLCCTRVEVWEILEPGHSPGSNLVSKTEVPLSSGSVWSPSGQGDGEPWLPSSSPLLQALEHSGCLGLDRLDSLSGLLLCSDTSGPCAFGIHK